MLKKLGLTALCAVSAFAMHSAELNINDKDLEVAGKLDMGQFNNAVEPDTVFLGAKYLKGSESHSDIQSNIEAFYEFNFLMKREIDNTGLSLGLGVKVNHTEKFTSIPLGVEAAYKLPVGDIVPLYVGGSIYYAPEVLAMDDAKDFLEYRVHFDIEVIKNGMITIGYRNIATNYELASQTNNISYNKSAYAGFKFAF
ncbi:hypothetical protein KKG72_00455 [bacterium]|nr:hypothetical protein [bacterium]MBU1993901.1 hypothetical protein [bacterium]